MNLPNDLNHCLSFINYNLQPAGHTPLGTAALPQRAAVTISRQSGCGAHVVAEKLAALLQARSPQDAPPWTIFDQNLTEKVLTEHNLPQRLAKFMPEDRVTEIEEIMDELFGLRPATWTLVEQTAETILQLAGLGHVIILGRGANVITTRMPHVLHVRLVAPIEKRIAHMRQFEELSQKAAEERTHNEDLGRKRYLQKHYHKDVDDPLLYHLVINTGLVSLDETARLITNAMHACCENLPQSKSGSAEPLAIG